MINIYLKIIKQLRDEKCSLIDEFDNEKVAFSTSVSSVPYFGISNLSTSAFKADDNLVYDEKINILN